MFLLKSIKENSPLALPASHGCWQSLVYLACSCVTLISASFVTWCPQPPTPLPVCLFSRKDTSHGTKAHVIPVWPHLNSTNYICKDPISKQSYILRFWLDMNFGGQNSSQLVIISALEMRRPEHRDEITSQVCPDNQWQSQDTAPKSMFLTATLCYLSKNISQMNK